LEGVAIEGHFCKTNVFDELQQCMNLKMLLQGGADFDGSKACAVMVGHKEMCEAVTKVLESKGVAKEHILLNF